MHWMFTIYSNHQDGNSLHRQKTVKFDVVGKRPATKYIQISDTLDYKNGITLNHAQLIFSKVPKWNGSNHLISQPELLVLPSKW